MSTTIQDIAQQLNLSKGTVSKALNGYHDVSPTTRELVLQTAQAMGYRPSAAARNLRRGRTDKIGLFLNTGVDYVMDYISGVIPGALQQAQAHDRNLLIYAINSDDPDPLLEVFRANEVDGVILFSTHYDNDTIETFLEANFPFVVMGRCLLDERVSYVVPDYYNGALQAMQHLTELGHTRIGFLSRPELTTANTARTNAYLDGLAAAGIEPDERYIVPTHVAPGSGAAATAHLLDMDAPPTAIFAFHDLLAAEAMGVLAARGLRVPDDVSVMGFDGLRAGLMTVPQVTTVAQPLADIGAEAVRILDGRIHNPDAPPIQREVPVMLVVRGTTAPPPR
jgi:LacI family transcriptional regulator